MPSCAERAILFCMKLAAFIAVATFAVASTARADEKPPRGDAVPPLAIAGESLLVASWVASAGAVIGTTSCEGGLLEGGIHCHSFSGYLFTPIAGPMIALGDNVGKPTMSGEIPFYVAMSAVNVLSMTAIIVGYATRSRTQVHFAPSVQASGHGGSVGFAGRF